MEYHTEHEMETVSVCVCAALWGCRSLKKRGSWAAYFTMILRELLGISVGNRSGF